MKGILGGNDDPEMGLESPLLDEDFGDEEGKEYRSPFMMKTKKYLHRTQQVHNMS